MILNCNSNKTYCEWDEELCGSPRWRWAWRSLAWLAAHPRAFAWIAVAVAIAFMAMLGLPAVWDGAHKFKELGQ